MATKEKELDSRGTLIDLPIQRFSLLSHVDNIDYAIEQIEAYCGHNPVVGYFKMRSLGTKEILHQVLPKEVAENMKREDENFDYITLDKLLERKREIEVGKYKLHEGLIVGLNQAHPHN